MMATESFTSIEHTSTSIRHSIGPSQKTTESLENVRPTDLPSQMSTRSFDSVHDDDSPLQREPESVESLRRSMTPFQMPLESFDAVRRSLSPSEMPSESFDSVRRSISPSKESFRRRSSVASSHKGRKSSIKTNYWPVAKWKVNYNNKNYIRSLTNKNHGSHRKIPKEHKDYDVVYNNKDYVKSYVNNHKGLHRKFIPIKRKSVPDIDDLADSAGWEFDYGPEFDQDEEDVPFIVEGEKITRGQFRWHGTIRNTCDYETDDEKEVENVNDIDEYNIEEFKSGKDFAQDDVPTYVHREKRVSRGGFRFIDVDRNSADKESVLDFVEESKRRNRLESIELRYNETLRSESDNKDVETERPKGSPFKQTILKRTFHFDTPATDSLEDLKEERRYRTEIRLTPGEGSKTFYKGVSSPISPFKVKKHPSIRRIFEPQSRRKSSSGSTGVVEDWQSGLRKETSRDSRGSSVYYDAQESFNDVTEKWKTVEAKKTRDRPSSSGRRNSEDKRKFFSAHNAWKKLMKEHSPELSARMRSNSKVAKHMPDYMANVQDRSPKLYTDEARRGSQSTVPKHLDDYLIYSKDVMEKKHISPGRKLPEKQFTSARNAWRKLISQSPELFRAESKLRSKPRAAQEISDFYDQDTMTRKQRKFSDIENKMKRYRNKAFKEMSDVDTHDDLMQERRSLLSDVNKRRSSGVNKMRRRAHKISRETSPGMSQFKEPFEEDEFLDIIPEYVNGLDKDELIGERPVDETITHGFEKYVSENGSELWVKKEEKFSIHHVEE